VSSLFLVQSNTTIALRLLLGFDRHSESVERRGRKIRRILTASPVDRRPQRTQCTVHRRNRAALPVRCLEAKHFCRLLQHRDRLIAEHCLDRLETALNRRRIAEPFSLDVVRVVRVEERGNCDADRGTWDIRRNPGVAPCDDFRQELRLPHLHRRLLRRDRRRGASGDGELVNRHPPPLSVVHHVEVPGMVASRARSTAHVSADLSNSHT